MIFMKYPLSLNIVRKLKVSDVVSFTGKIVLVGEAAFQRIVNYERAEGLIPDFIKGELVCFGFVEQGLVRGIPAKNCEPFLEKAFLYGATSIIAFDSKIDEALFKKFARVLFVPESEIRPSMQRIIAHVDLDREAVHEIEVSRLIMRVAIDSKGNRTTLEVKI
ncbi:hypothetical protein [Pseudothermotoga sp.]|nr:hypothetical protein [Pseudothermotoga sp.]MDW8139602.1 hypothetical protein [Pseudothermotoga sp.]